ncbi:N-acetyl-gamma-glutamyl-phosphate reductase [Chryseobacterium carnipullorum]|uniref:N-acetyl-gamma-glutamyl-phosphate reductase n=1 Tax=Chryseobacterium carnipullorum TaxID=1124835 RepID=A0A376E4I2_CHRCU|nr:N-acetyl-gamma-glutamyl-phosphate reductase [Chryseobacterium carnipullorum]AZA50715.1 N-acetyl-gamma-glutamyl-phosphate reductase [Chryseobacterium carnipullorum]AZA65581.1 N-acetyl-gamma-glutamyl-phosphate reductase [Chryseobacterium carnipullorum]STD01553.1 N-acetyl-gamma-glutamyl-phosphate reductase [Chryseobacterium carnipullorum]
MKKVGIVGANGYTGSELIRVLAFHPNVSLSFLYSRSNPGTKISDLYPDLTAVCEQVLTDKPEDVDILFLCLPHKESQNWLNQNPVEDETLVIDLGNDFRLDGNFGNRNFIYGLPEINKKNLAEAKSIANPGCFATAIQLALFPLAEKGLLNEVYTTGITGSTGAGQSLQATTHFTWRNDNISAYKTLTHQHVDEILHQLVSLNNKEISLNFVPWRGDFARGIFTSSTVKTELVLSDMVQLYQDFYEKEPFVKVSDNAIDLKQVVNTNRCVIHIEKSGNVAVIHSAIDNLLKGASGQAVQNMNIAMGWEENLGLNLKPIAF